MKLILAFLFLAGTAWAQTTTSTTLMPLCEEPNAKVIVGGTAAPPAGRCISTGTIVTTSSTSSSTSSSSSSSTMVTTTTMSTTTTGAAGTGAHLFSIRQGGSTTSHATQPNGVVTDSSGNVYVAGAFAGIVNFGGSDLSSGSSGADIFLAKYNSSLAHQSSFRFGGPTFDQYAHGIAVDSSNNIYIVGKFSSTVDFGAGTLTSFGSYDIFIAKFNSSLVLQWSKQIGGTNWDEGIAITVDFNGDVIITGQYAGSVNFGGGALPALGSFDVFVAKYAGSDGSFVWASRHGGTAGDFGKCIGVDSVGSVVVSGYYAGTANFGGAAMTSAGQNDVFAAKYSASGVHQWSQRYGSTGDERGISCAVAGDGSVVLTGWFNGSVNFGGTTLTNANGADIFLARLTSSGGHSWSKQFNSSIAISASETPSAVTFGPGGTVALTGQIVGNVSFGGSELTASAFSGDIFAARFTSAGLHIWSKRFEAAFDDTASSVTVDSNLNTIIVGQYNEPLSFGGAVLPAPSRWDGVTAKYAP